MEPAPIGSFRLIRINRPLRLLVISRAISFVGSSMGLVALLLHLSTPLGVAAVTLLLLCGDMLPALLAPLTGVLADRIELRRLMVICEVGQGLVTAVIAIWLPAVPILLVLFTIRAVLGQIFQPASRAAVPTLVADDQLLAANTRWDSVKTASRSSARCWRRCCCRSPASRGSYWSTRAAFWSPAVLLIGLPSLPAVPLGLGEEGSFLRHAGRGLREVWRAVGVRVVIISFAAVVAFNGVDDVALVFLATGPLGGSQSAAGLLYAGAAVGLLFGYALVSRLSTVWSAVVLLTVGYAVSSLGNLLTGLAGAVIAALALQTVRGLGIAAQDVAAVHVDPTRGAASPAGPDVRHLLRRDRTRGRAVVRARRTVAGCDRAARHVRHRRGRRVVTAAITAMVLRADRRRSPAQPGPA